MEKSLTKCYLRTVTHDYNTHSANQDKSSDTSGGSSQEKTFSSGKAAAGPSIKAHNVNAYLKLLMNLMNVFTSDNEKEMDCVWAIFCHRLNKQAEQGGVISSVARINRKDSNEFVT